MAFVAASGSPTLLCRSMIAAPDRLFIAWITRLLTMEAAWRKIAPRSKIVYVKGSHITMMRSPEGCATAKHLAERIAEVESPSEFAP
jgi:hypothetical protein